ncbi:MAG: flagellar biosynthetic protein FliO [Candidatus Margulisbacteria bacterium]|nr:flagellar biosynthetic protein FliO [Candidatus Margulisiibacteriota bacterium]
MTAEALSFQSTPIVTFGYIMQVIVSLLVVLGFIWLAAKYLLPKLKVSDSGKLIKILDRAYLEPQVTAYLLRVGGKAWLVGTSNKNIALIDKIDLKEAVNE